VPLGGVSHEPLPDADSDECSQAQTSPLRPFGHLGEKPFLKDGYQTSRQYVGLVSLGMRSPSGVKKRFINGVLQRPVTVTSIQPGPVGLVTFCPSASKTISVEPQLRHFWGDFLPIRHRRLFSSIVMKRMPSTPRSRLLHSRRNTAYLMSRSFKQRIRKRYLASQISRLASARGLRAVKLCFWFFDRSDRRPTLIRATSSEAATRAVFRPKTKTQICHRKAPPSLSPRSPAQRAM
jgi:hypothetical protein